MTSPVRTGSVRSNGSIVSRSLWNVWVVPSTVTGPTRPRIASNACGQSSSAPSSSPIRWSGIVDPFHGLEVTVQDLQADALVVLALALRTRDAYGAHLGGRQHVRAAVGLAVEPHDVDHPQRVDGLRDQVGAGTDQGRVCVGKAS